MSIEAVNSTIAQRDPPKETRATLGMVLAMIGQVVESVNESYEVAGKVNREFIKFSFDFVKQAAESMKTAELWKAGGMIAGGILGLGLGAASLKASGGLAAQAKNNAPLIQEKADQIRALDRAQIAREQPAVDRASQAINEAPRELEMVEIRARPAADPDILDGQVRIEARPHAENVQPNDALTEGQKNREAKALEIEKDQFEKLDPKLSFWANSHMLGQPVSQAIGGATQTVASGHEETSKVEQGVSGTFNTEQQLASGLYSGLHQTLVGVLIVETIMQAAIAASQIR